MRREGEGEQIHLSKPVLVHGSATIENDPGQRRLAFLRGNESIQEASGLHELRGIVKRGK
jgi:hypothetical protein